MVRPELKLGRSAYGGDPEGYHAARRDYPARLFELLGARCAIGPATRAFEIGPGTGKATRPMLDLGLGSVVGVEPDARLVDYLRAQIPDPRLRFETATFEAADLPEGGFELGYAASSFHWLDTVPALEKVARLLRPGGTWAMWWNFHQDPDRPDPFGDAVTPLIRQLRAEAPSFRSEPRDALPGGLPLRLARTLRVDERVAELRAIGFSDIEHETIRDEACFDTAAMRALYGSYSVMREVTPERGQAFLDRVAEIVETEFGGQIRRACVMPVYTARR
jgi:SAM-dependent methyltransferase